MLKLVRIWFDPLSSMVKAKKGSVAVYVADDRLRLRWSSVDAQGKAKRFSMAFGAVNATNRLAAERLAREIELDIVSGNFDASLRKYKRHLDREEGIALETLFERYIANQIDGSQSSSLERYTTLKHHVLSCFGNINVEAIGEAHTQKFIRYLTGRKLKGETVNLYLTLLRSVWRWAMKRGLTQINPWLELAVETEPKPAPKPFNRKEIEQILKGFEASYYRDFVQFLLGIGCRIGEAIALSWDAVSEDGSEVWIGRSWDAKGKRVKSTKTNETRTVPVSVGIQEMLLRRREERTGELVFPAQQGGFIDRHNFINRHWKPMLKKLEIPYRPPYNSRHTRWSHEIAGGMDIATAAAYAGNRPRTMLNRYYGATDRPRLKDWD
jgi:integrase